MPKVTLECPKCHKKWAELKFEYDSAPQPEDVRVLKGNKKFGKDDELKCSLCDYPYTNWDIMLAIAGGTTKKNGKK